MKTTINNELMDSINKQALNISASGELRYPEVHDAYIKTLAAQLSLGNIKNEDAVTTEIVASDAKPNDFKQQHVYSFRIEYSNGKGMDYSCNAADLGEAFRTAGKNLMKGDSIRFVTSE